METLHQTIPNMFQKHPKDVKGVMIKSSSKIFISTLIVLLKNVLPPIRLRSGLPGEYPQKSIDFIIKNGKLSFLNLTI